jgi:hypothetical protein
MVMIRIRGRMIADEKTRKKLTKNIVFLNDRTWVDHINDDKITVLHFLSSVNLVSREQIPSIREFAAKYGNKYTIGVLDAGLCPNACRSCKIQGLPAMIIIRKGLVLGAYRGHFHKEDESELLLQLNAWQQMDIDNDIASKNLDSSEDSEKQIFQVQVNQHY